MQACRLASRIVLGAPLALLAPRARAEPAKPDEAASRPPDAAGETPMIHSQRGAGFGAQYGHVTVILVRDAQHHDPAALGERSHIAAVTQNQIAATLAALLGEDYPADVSKAGKPIADVLPH